MPAPVPARNAFDAASEKWKKGGGGGGGGGGGETERKHAERKKEREGGGTSSGAWDRHLGEMPGEVHLYAARIPSPWYPFLSFSFSPFSFLREMPGLRSETLRSAIKRFTRGAHLLRVQINFLL